MRPFSRDPYLAVFYQNLSELVFGAPFVEIPLIQIPLIEIPLVEIPLVEIPLL